jgi:hypothetical protein
MLLGKLTCPISLVCYLAIALSGCGGSDGPKPSTPAPVQPPVVLTPERDGHSVGRMWNEALLHAIRNDFARPTVHARNLHHVSAAMFDSWATYTSDASRYLFGNQVQGFSCAATDFSNSVDILPLQEEAMSYAAYQLIKHRFRFSPGVGFIYNNIDNLMQDLGFDTSNTNMDYTSGSAAALGNAIAQCYIDFGLQDGSNEHGFYDNTAYQSVNPPLVLDDSAFGNRDIVDLNRWQPLSIEGFIDQAGNPVDTSISFLSPEWGQVTPFSLSENDKTSFQRDDFDYQVYHDPGAPPKIDGAQADLYKWGFSLVSIWSSHLAADDGVMWDISPNALGNIDHLPTEFNQYAEFYSQTEGGDPSRGYALNPVTNEPYAEQWVPRGDYTRVLAEFWADGPESETPPGHWFVILNTIIDHPLFEKRWAGQGDILSNLEWDIKSYFSLGGAMHDSAIAAWGIKGWYDYIRPVSAIRAMSDKGQSSDPNLPSYHADGLPLVPGYIEIVASNDELAGSAQEHVGKIKLYTWKGPSYIDEPDNDQAGVGWILAQNWWPYQRPTFVTPPFAGYVSGHSTYSRAAAELLTAMTGTAYFPGGMSEFQVPANDFLVFENGPSVDITLQWATYIDASDQCSLSRIWGGIHPPVDDIPGRLIGKEIGQQAFTFTSQYFND